MAKNKTSKRPKRQAANDIMQSLRELAKAIKEGVQLRRIENRVLNPRSEIRNRQSRQ